MLQVTAGDLVLLRGSHQQAILRQDGEAQRGSLLPSLILRDRDQCLLRGKHCQRSNVYIAAEEVRI